MEIIRDYDRRLRGYSHDSRISFYKFTKIYGLEVITSHTSLSFNIPPHLHWFHFISWREHQISCDKKKTEGKGNFVWHWNTVGVNVRLLTWKPRESCKQNIEVAYFFKTNTLFTFVSLVQMCKWTDKSQRTNARIVNPKKSVTCCVCIIYFIIITKHWKFYIMYFASLETFYL